MTMMNSPTSRLESHPQQPSPSSLLPHSEPGANLCLSRWGPAATRRSSSRTESRYRPLSGRLEMELFIGPTLSSLLCAGFIIAPAVFGRQYLSLVSCAAIPACCSARGETGAPTRPIYHPSQRGSWIKKPPSVPGR